MSNEKTNAEPSGASGGSVSIGEAQNTGSDEWYCPRYLCPECKKDYINRAFNYCPNCGVKIEWQE